MPDVLKFTMDDIEGNPTKLDKYQGKVVLMVNVASRCGLTPQYKGLEALYEKYGAKGFAIAAFPANDFKGQEPGTNEEIQKYCTDKYAVTFDLFSKVSVKGEDQCALYKYLTQQTPGPAPAGDITWNFEKFLVSREGKVVARFAPQTTPEDAALVTAIEEQLNN